MIEILALGILAAPFLAVGYTKEAIDDFKRSREVRNYVAPGLSSQAAQIKPLTAEQIALGKKAYLGPKRPRPVRKPKRLR